MEQPWREAPIVGHCKHCGQPVTRSDPGAEYEYCHWDPVFPYYCKGFITRAEPAPPVRPSGAPPMPAVALARRQRQRFVFVEPRP